MCGNDLVVGLIYEPVSQYEWKIHNDYCSVSTSFFEMRHYSDVTMSTMASQIIRLAIAYSTVYSGADQRALQSSTSLAYGREIHR